MTAGEGTPKRARFDFAGIAGGMSALADVTNASPRRRRSAKCLFGAPDRDETQRLVAEQYARDRKRYIRRFNFDIETESTYEAEEAEAPPFIRSAAEALAARTGTAVSPGTPQRRRAPRTPAKLSPRTSPRSPRTPRTPRSPRTPNSRRQLHLTDYWALRKRTESTSDKEN